MTSIVHVQFSAFTAYIGRNPRHGDTRWGNPFRLDVNASRTETYLVVRSFAKWLRTRDALLAEIPSLRGEILGCHCRRPDRLDWPCHGQVLAAWADQGIGTDWTSR